VLVFIHVFSARSREKPVQPAAMATHGPHGTPQPPRGGRYPSKHYVTRRVAAILGKKGDGVWLARVVR